MCAATLYDTDEEPFEKDIFFFVSVSKFKPLHYIEQEEKGQGH